VAFRIVIAEDHETVRSGLRAFLHARPEWEVCGEAVDGNDALEKVKQLKPDLIMLDIHLPNLDGIATAREILIQRPSTKILIVSMMTTETLIRQAKQMGFHGFISKSHVSRDLFPAIEAIQRGQTFFRGDEGPTSSGGSSVLAA